MLIIPYQTRFTAKSLPVVTLALILACAFAFFFLQARDQALYRDAFAQYARSDLPAIELPRYRDWLLGRGDVEALQQLERLRAMPAGAGIAPAAMMLQAETKFVAELQRGRVIRSDEPIFDAWQESRSRFEAALQRPATERYAMKPRSGEPWRLLTHQFLHGDLGHLLGNMVVLLLAGPFAEAALGRRRFLLGYLASGALSGALFSMLADGALIGASGAISGAMAMVAVLYGRRRVPVFYWVLFYFDTARLPALALLPVWIVNELYQWAATPASRVAYAAHLAGFVAGALAAWLLRERGGRRVERVLDETFADERRAQQRSSLESRAQETAARLDTKRAAALYRELADQDPNRVDYHSAYLNTALLAGEADALADAASRLLGLRFDAAPGELRKAYLQISRPTALAALAAPVQLRLVRRLANAREHAAALQVLDRLLSDEKLRQPNEHAIGDCLAELFGICSRLGLTEQAEAIRARLAKHFPSGPPAATGAQPRIDSG